MSNYGELILVRHGQSQWNLENRFTGWTDVPLTEAGIEEARHAGRLLKDYHFDKAFTSSLVRAQETLRYILEVTGQTDVPIERDQALNERHYGDLQGLNKDETALKFGKEQVHIWRRSYDIAPPNGESLKDTRARVMPYYEAHIEPLLKAGKKVLIVARCEEVTAGLDAAALKSILEDLENKGPAMAAVASKLAVTADQAGNGGEAARMRELAAPARHAVGLPKTIRAVAVTGGAGSPGLVGAVLPGGKNKAADAVTAGLGLAAGAAGEVGLERVDRHVDLVGVLEPQAEVPGDRVLLHLIGAVGVDR